MEKFLYFYRKKIKNNLKNLIFFFQLYCRYSQEPKSITNFDVYHVNEFGFSAKMLEDEIKVKIAYSSGQSRRKISALVKKYWTTWTTLKSFR